MVKIPVSVVATTFNNEDEIMSFLDNLELQTVFVEEIIISDGGSKDATVQVIQEQARRFKNKIIIRSGKRLNIAEGYNDAIKAASQEVIAVLGVGNFFPSDFLEKLYNSFLVSKADVMCPFICGQDNTEFAAAYNLVYLNNNTGSDGSNAPNHGCIAKKKIFSEIGYFYEKFIYAGEDAEFFSLAKEKGYKVVADKGIKIYWDTPRSWKELKRQINVYTIADEQWQTAKRILWSQKKNIVSVLSIILGIFLILLSSTRWLGIGLICLNVIRFCLWIKQYGWLGMQIQSARNYYKLYCYLRNIKYAQKKFRVIRT